MRGHKQYLEGLIRLHEIVSPDERRAAWRQSMATLGEATLERDGVPLEGVDPDALLRSARSVLASDLIDDLSFLSPAAAACALYGLASALPHGAEKRELGRRVLVRLHQGDAATFVALATALALGSTRAFEGAGVRARVGLSLVLPISVGSRPDALALALISRRELAQRWLVEPSSGSLPARRMAARLLERAAREAARRAAQGDDGGVWLLESHAVRGAFSHLMADREPLVWRHIATARGLLSGVVSRFADEIDRDLAVATSSSRSRRAAASLAAQVAVRPQEALGRARQLMESSSLERDPGLAAAMIYGLPRAAEVEPEAAEELLVLAIQGGDTMAAEALSDLRLEWSSSDFGIRAAELARVQLRQRYGAGSDDDGHTALVNLLCEALGESGDAAPDSLPSLVARAVSAFAEVGAREAYEQARAALKIADTEVDRLTELLGQDTTEARRATFRLLHELDAGLLESSALGDLLSLGGAGNDTARVTAPLHAIMLRLTEALMSIERSPYRGGEQVPHLILRMRMLRTLLHLLDDDGRYGDRRDGAGRERRLGAVRQLLERIARDEPSAMDRIVHATVARGCDSLVRDELFELSDVVLAAAVFVPTPGGFTALAEGSMLPDVKRALKALASLVRTLHRTAKDADGRRALIEALFELTRALPADSAPRTEGLRASLLRLSRSLRRIQSAPSIRALADDLRAMELLGRAVDELVQLATGLRRRLGFAGSQALPTSGHGVWALGMALERMHSEEDRGGLELTLETLADSLRMELPAVFASVALRILQPLLDKPLETPRTAAPPSVAPGAIDGRPLPAWLPPARILGGFYVLRALGAGAGGSVFVVTRAEDRNDPRCSKLALKVPEYDGAAARSLSEEEFLRLFRQEAGALLAVPQHTNVAEFVTFDAGVRPKPILVMELVEGPTLERVLARGEMDVDRAVALIDGVLAGLEAMHSVGVGHLDVKPSNVILREQNGQAAEPVLVDFGLAGRHVRPGCATGNYGAPEVWGLVPDGHTLQPMPADVYAAGCVAFEVLTGQTLFSAPTETAMIAAHISHDGGPGAVSALANEEATRPLAQWLGACLRQDPRQRATVRDLRVWLSDVRGSLGNASWPIPVHDEETIFG